MFILFWFWIRGIRKAHVAISQFRGQQNGKKGCERSVSKSIQVLLLLIQHGANGLNLLEAQHVVLVEPLLNPAAEAQAISRVHRIGQKNKTLIHRFIVSFPEGTNVCSEYCYVSISLAHHSVVIFLCTLHLDQNIEHNLGTVCHGLCGFSKWSCCFIKLIFYILSLSKHYFCHNTHRFLLFTFLLLDEDLACK